MSMKRKDLSVIVDRCIPSNLRGESPQYVALIENYFEYLSRAMGEADIPSNLPDYLDIDKTTQEFLDEIKAEVAENVPINIIADEKLFLKNIRDFFTNKGNENSYKFLFKSLFDRKVDFYYPKVDILRCSDGKWVQPYYIHTDISDTLLLAAYKDKFITGDISEARGYVETYTTVGGNPVFAVLNKVGNFIVGEDLTIENPDGVYTTVQVFDIIDDLPGSWTNRDGFLSSDKKLQDNNYYQDFSYVLGAEMSARTYKGVLKRLIHPAGMKLFGTWKRDSIERYFLDCYQFERTWEIEWNYYSVDMDIEVAAELYLQDHTTDYRSMRHTSYVVFEDNVDEDFYTQTVSISDIEHMTIDDFDTEDTTETFMLVRRPIIELILLITEIFGDFVTTNNSTLYAPTPATQDGFGLGWGDGVEISNTIFSVSSASTEATFIGRVDVFDKETLAPIFALNTPNPVDYAGFGASVHITDDYIFVGSPGEWVDGTIDSAGRAYVFDAVTGDLVHTLEAPDAQEWDYFGISGRIESGKIYVGAAWESGGAGDPTPYEGCIYVFDLITGNYLSTIRPSAGSGNGDSYAYTMDSHDGTIIVGSQGLYDAVGKSYVYDAATGNELHVLNLPAPIFGDVGFGSNVAIYGDYCCVAEVADNTATGTGAVYVFDLTTGNFMHRLTASNANTSYSFGTSIALHGTTLAVGDRPQKAVYVFDIITETETRNILYSDVGYELNDNFGTSVDIQGDTLLAAADLDDYIGNVYTNSGAVEVFKDPNAS